MRMVSVLLLAASLFPASLRAAGYEPDPRSVQRHGEAYRYPQAGWIVLHVEGAPYERGVQHGRLLAPEIAAYVRCFASMQCPKSPSEGWKITRTLTNALFLRRFDREYLEEMKGIADGAAAGGAKFDGRAIDLVDIVALNAMEEIETLDSALEALPTGLEGIRFPKDSPKKPLKAKPSRCSAFAANGTATKDGKIVFGHITMSNLYAANYCNVWIDLKPAKGRRFVMQSYPGGIQSGVDYYVNDAGLLICETTIGQTKFDIKGMALASRIRKAIQYAETIDRAVECLKEGNNGLYSNEWLLGDTKTNEIAMFELGTHKSKLWRSSKNEWFGGTEGFYWGCNNAKDLDVRLETAPSVEARPAVPIFHPSDRDVTWLKLFDRHKGKMDLDFAKLAFTTPPLAAYHSADVKIVTTELARDLKSLVLFGPPLGRTWEPTHDERDKHPEIRPLVSNPWAILHTDRPAARPADLLSAVDLHEPLKEQEIASLEPVDDEETVSPTVPAWHGTILPKSDAEVWLSAGFSRYEKIVAHENALRKAHSDGKLTESDKQSTATALLACRADYELGARAEGDVPLSKIRSDNRREGWYRIASGKGTLLLHALRDKLGAETFDDMMNRFGKANAGKATSTEEFRTSVSKAAEKELGDFFEIWLDRTGLPSNVRDRSGPYAVTTFYAELDQTLIIYGTADESPANREGAKALQQAIRARHANVTVPIKADKDLSPEELKSHHLLLIGRPDSNRLVERMRASLPVQFGPRSFAVHGSEDAEYVHYAHPGSAVVAAAVNPENPRFSVVVVAGLDAFSTRHAAGHLPRLTTGEIVVLPNGGTAKAMVGRGVARP